MGKNLKSNPITISLGKALWRPSDNKSAWINLMHVYLTLIDIRSNVQYSSQTTFVIPLLPNYVETIHIRKVNMLICTFRNDKTKSIQFR